MARFTPVIDHGPGCKQTAGVHRALTGLQSKSVTDHTGSRAHDDTSRNVEFSCSDCKAVKHRWGHWSTAAGSGVLCDQA